MTTSVIFREAPRILSDLDGQHPVALQLDAVVGNGLINDRAGRNETGEVDIPQLGAALGALLVHHRDGAICRICDRAWKPLQQKVGAEPVVAVPVSGIDRGQAFAGTFDPVTDPADLLTGEGRVDQDSMAVAVDQRGSHR